MHLWLPPFSFRDKLAHIATKGPSRMPVNQSESGLETEFRILAARAGVTVPEERMANILLGYADFRAQLELLRGAGRDHTAELANVFRLPVPGTPA
jgi:hypothetical protein